MRILAAIDWAVTSCLELKNLRSFKRLGGVLAQIPGEVFLVFKVGLHSA